MEEGRGEGGREGGTEARWVRSTCRKDYMYGVDVGFEFACSSGCKLQYVDHRCFFYLWLDWLPLPCIALIRPSQLSCLGNSVGRTSAT